MEIFKRFDEDDIVRQRDVDVAANRATISSGDDEDGAEDEEMDNDESEETKSTNTEEMNVECSDDRSNSLGGRSSDGGSGGRVETLTSKRRRFSQHRRKNNGDSSAPLLPSALQLQLDQSALQLELVKCELQWRIKQTEELSKKLVAKEKKKTGVDVCIQTALVSR